MAEQPSSALAMLTEFFSGEHIEATARRTGFVQRTSKITGKLFLALITFGHWSDAQTTLAQLAAKATQLGPQVTVSPEALYQRMNKRALAFLQEMLRTALAQIHTCAQGWALVPFDVIRHEHNISGRYGCRESKSSREEHPCHRHLGGNA